jgi:molybdopterin/thiamine biosynthesis adenylyltransferase
LLKVDAVAAIIADHAPWTEVERVAENPNTPTRVAELSVGVDLIIDATGSEAATHALVASSTLSTRPLVSGALYRGGAIARVQRQARSSDVNIHARTSAQGYTLIPPGANDEEMVEPAVGCSAPVNNAPPSSVFSCAALIAQVAVDALAGAFNHADEVIDIYRALVGEPPFDRTGRLGALGDA